MVLALQFTIVQMLRIAVYTREISGLDATGLSA